VEESLVYSRVGYALLTIEVYPACIAYSSTLSSVVRGRDFNVRGLWCWSMRLSNCRLTLNSRYQIWRSGGGDQKIWRWAGLTEAQLALTSIRLTVQRDAERRPRAGGALAGPWRGYGGRKRDAIYLDNLQYPTW